MQPWRSETQEKGREWEGEREMFKFKSSLFILIVKKTIKYKHDLRNTLVACKNKVYVLVDQFLFLWYVQRRT